MCFSENFAGWFSATHLGAYVWDSDDLELCDIRVGVSTRNDKCMAWPSGISKDE